MNAKGLREPNKLKRDLNAGKVCFGATITMSNPVISEILSHMNFDWVWIEAEHTPMSDESVQAMLQSTNGSDVTTIVRVPWNDKTMLKRILDTGPDGVIVPLIRSKAEAEEAVKAIKYPPLGERGAGLGRAQCYGLHMGEYLGESNNEVMTILMIEHIDAVNDIENILQVPGVDSIMVGALDLSGSMGKLGQTADPEVEGAVQKVLEACKKYKIPAGIITLDPVQVRERVTQGFQNIIIGIDVLFVISAANAVIQALDDLRTK